MIKAIICMTPAVSNEIHTPFVSSIYNANLTWNTGLCQVFLWDEYTLLTARLCEWRV
jgi:hypothetical protein